MVEHSKHNLQKGLSEIWLHLGNLERLSRLGIWLQFVGQAWRSVRAAPLTAILTIFTVALGVFLLSSFIWIFQNLTVGLAATQASLQVTLFLKDQADPEAVAALQAELEKRAEVSSVLFFDKLSALDALQRDFADQAALLSGLDRDNNPLPASFEVGIKSDQNTAAIFDDFVGHYRGDPLIEYIDYDQGVLEQLDGLIALLRRFGVIGAFSILLVIGVIIANTIRLALHVHRQELEIMNLVGADQGFVQIPFLVEGAVHGVVGALFGVMLLYPLTLFSKEMLQKSPLLAMILPEPQFLSVWSLLFVIVLSGLVGFLSSYLGVRRLG